MDKHRIERAAAQRTAALVFCLLAVAQPCRAGGFRAAAAELARAASRAGMQRIAVLPFVPSDESGREDGHVISERLVTQLVRQGRIQVVERRLLAKMVEEQSLGATGLLDAATVKKLGKLLSVDAIATGTYVSVDNGIIADARLIHIETGVIVAARELAADRDWTSAAGGRGGLGGDPFAVPVPPLTVPVPPLLGEAELLRDALNDGPDCEDAARRADAYEASILDLKARYWALELKKGGSRARPKANPGSTITDPRLKERFRGLLTAYYAASSVPALTPDEVRRFITADEKAFRLHQDCGL